MSVTVMHAVPLAAPEVCSSCFHLVNRSSSHRSDAVVYFHVRLIGTYVYTNVVQSVAVVASCSHLFGNDVYDFPVFVYMIFSFIVKYVSNKPVYELSTRQLLRVHINDVSAAAF